MHFVLSIHDVSPFTRAKVDALRAALPRVPASLLVIPDHHGRGRFRDDPGFVAWLRAREAEGDEIVVHGYTHRRAPRPDESATTKLITRHYTAGEGEFHDLPEQDAARLLACGLADFHSCGFDPRGFIAPAWLLGEGAERAVAAAGFEYTVRLGGVLAFRPDRAYHASQSLVWSVRAPWRRACSLAWNAFLFRRLKNASLLRISLHPPDTEHPRILTQIRQLLNRALAERTPTTYLRWIRGLAQRFGKE